MAAEMVIAVGIRTGKPWSKIGRRQGMNSIAGEIIVCFPSPLTLYRWVDYALHLLICSSFAHS